MGSNPSTDLVQIVFNTTYESCEIEAKSYEIPATDVFCNWTWDKILCWPPTAAGSVAIQKCPPHNGIDTTQYAFRRCSTEGKWEGRPGSNATSTYGWTNYTPCYSPEMRELMKRLYINDSQEEAQLKIDIAAKTRIMEIVGLSLSLAALVLSLIIFFRFRSLRNNRTRIHKNLFVAMVIQVVIRLTLYVDQAIVSSGREVDKRVGLHNTPLLCEPSYVLLEYARTAMFMWMFIEGLYLHNVVTVTVFQGRFPHKIYAVAGWGSPIVLTAIWAIVTAKYKAKLKQKCWWGYNLTPYYWILEGPRLAVILLNFFFLLNIIRVLVVKLRQSHHTTDLEKSRKAVRAAVVLLPLLGITNLLNMTEAPLEKSAWEFGLWSYSTHFLTSFQGFFIAMIYCFLNGEVRIAVMKSISVYLSIRGVIDWHHRRPSMFSGAYVTPETEINNNDSEAREKPSSIRRNWFCCCVSNQPTKDMIPACDEPFPPETTV